MRLKFESDFFHHHYFLLEIHPKLALNYQKIHLDLIFQLLLKTNEKEVTNKLSVPRSWIMSFVHLQMGHKSVLLHYHCTINCSKHKNMNTQGRHYKHVKTNLYTHVGKYSYGKHADEIKQTNK